MSSSCYYIKFQTIPALPAIIAGNYKALVILFMSSSDSVLLLNQKPALFMLAFAKAKAFLSNFVLGFCSLNKKKLRA